jgi:hypothetical protein
VHHYEDEDEDEEREFFVDRWGRRFATDIKFRLFVLRTAWLAALGMLLLGFALMVLILTGNSPF